MAIDHTISLKAIAAATVGIAFGLALAWYVFVARRTPSSSSGPTRGPAPMSAAPRLEWWRFGMLATLISAIFIAIAALPRHHEPDPAIKLALLSFGASLIGFFAYRWYTMRLEFKEGRFSLPKYRENPQRYICGPI